MQDEHLLTVAEASHECPARPSIRTIWRWMQRGIRGIQLESLVIGGRRYTSREALARFIGRTSEVAVSGPLPSKSNVRRLQRLHQVEEQLDQDGIF